MNSKKMDKENKGRSESFCYRGETKLACLKAYMLCHFVFVKTTRKLSRTLGSLFAVIRISLTKLVFPRFGETFFLTTASSFSAHLSALLCLPKSRY
jgi:hypothetical protein